MPLPFDIFSEKSASRQASLLLTAGAMLAVLTLNLFTGLFPSTKLLVWSLMAVGVLALLLVESVQIRRGIPRAPALLSFQEKSLPMTLSLLLIACTDAVVRGFLYSIYRGEICLLLSGIVLGVSTLHHVSYLRTLSRSADQEALSA